MGFYFYSIAGIYMKHDQSLILLAKRRHQQKKPGKINDKCQITSYPLPPQPNKDKINSDNKLEV